MTTEEIAKHLEQISKDAKHYHELRRLVVKMREEQIRAASHKKLNKIGAWVSLREMFPKGTERAVDDFLERTINDGTRDGQDGGGVY